MFEFTTVVTPGNDPEGLSRELSTKSLEGWEVLEIMNTPDGHFCAFLKRALKNETKYSTNAPSTTVPRVPAAWYADPSGRYELRYWDGSEWTEHVARGGQQFVDPPVA
jgi:hypothetical protein